MGKRVDDDVEAPAPRRAYAGVRDLKNSTSRLLRVARSGRDVVITKHGRPIAILRGLTEVEKDDYVFAGEPEIRPKTWKEDVDAQATGRKRARRRSR